MFAETNFWQELLAYLSLYKAYAYPVLFLGAFLETVIPFSFIVYGEIFFLAGAVLAGTGSLDIKLVAAVLYVGGILGDSCSYMLGRRYGTGLFEKLSTQRFTGRFFRDEIRKKGIVFFNRWGASAVFLARLSGPFSWFVPALAGAFKLDYGRFLIFNMLGVIIGIGEFLLLGYLLGNHLDEICTWLNRLGSIPVLILAFVLLVIVLRWISSRQARRKAENANC
ncbi:DedA family protein [Desulfosediminicola sp.]|uniref:DedA family protein n=1 Tax=Desulfosediminicola sp. TaxID=2886825 RepID=UPI003AF2E587